MDPYRNFNQYKIDPISEIRNAGIITNGSVFWVKDSADSDYVHFQDQVGADSIRPTIQGGVDLTRADKNDYVFVSPRDANAVWTATAALDINKDRVHVMSIGYTKALRGYSNTLRGFATAGTADQNGLMDVTADGAEVAGFYFLGTAGTSSGGTLGDNGTSGIVTVFAGVHDFHLHDFRIERTTDNWDDGTPSAALYLGSASKGHVIENGVIHAGTSTAVTTSNVKLPFNGEDITFREVRMIRHSITTGDQFVTSNGGTMSGMFATFERCQFINTNAGTKNASAVGGTFPVGGVGLILESSGINVTETGTPTSFFVAPASGTATVVRNNYLGLGTTALISV